MQDTTQQFIDFYGVINARFNSLGAIDQGRDGVFFGTPRPRITSQMLRVSKQTGEADADKVLTTLRTIYSEAEHAIAGGLSGDCRDSLIDALIAEVK